MDRKPRFFDYNGPLMTAFQTAASFLLLNLLFLLCCVPVVTIGAALMSLTGMMLDRCQGERAGHVGREFMRRMRQNFGRGAALSAILCVIFVPATLDILWLSAGERALALGFMLGIVLLLGMSVAYYIPVLCSGAGLWASACAAFHLALKNWWRSALTVGLTAAPTVLCLRIPSFFLSILPILLLVGFSSGSYLICRLLYPTLPRR